MLESSEPPLNTKTIISCYLVNVEAHQDCEVVIKTVVCYFNVVL